MKLKELISVLDRRSLVDFEIRGKTRPEEIYAKDILSRFPSAINSEVLTLDSAIAHRMNGNYPKLYIEVEESE